MMRWPMSGTTAITAATKKGRTQLHVKIQEVLVRMGLFRVFNLSWTARMKNERRLRTALLRRWRSPAPAPACRTALMMITFKRVNLDGSTGVCSTRNGKG